VKLGALKNVTDALTPTTGVGCVLPETGPAITYPKDSSGPFHQTRLLGVKPVTGTPLIMVPFWVVPFIVEPVLYENGLDFGMINNKYHYDIKPHQEISLKTNKRGFFNVSLLLNELNYLSF
jgi:hypothetical protein